MLAWGLTSRDVVDLEKYEDHSFKGYDREETGATTGGSGGSNCPLFLLVGFRLPTLAFVVTLSSMQ